MCRQVTGNEEEEGDGGGGEVNHGYMEWSSMDGSNDPMVIILVPLN